MGLISVNNFNPAQSPVLEYAFFAENKLTSTIPHTTFKSEIMKYLLVFLVIGIISCNKNKNENNNIHQPIYQTGDTIVLAIKNNLSSELTNVKIGYVEWDWDDDIDTRAFLIKELGELNKNSTTKTDVHRKWGEVTVWFDFLSKTFMVPVPVSREVGSVYQITSEMKLWNQVDKSSNRYPQ